jgi:hypothetical protein
MVTSSGCFGLRASDDLAVAPTVDETACGVFERVAECARFKMI